MSGAKLEVQIEYCGPCGYAPLAAQVAEELVTEYSSQLAGVTLVPSSGGTFEVRAGGRVVFSLDAVGRFPEKGEVSRLLKEKQLLC
ncbi:MAG: selenoprotein [Bacillota bacterium]|nr:MAG: selenoprotein [Bacillota bacterium]